MSRLLFGVVLFIISPAIAFAHGMGYFPFDPDISNHYVLSSGDTPYEVFKPHNEYLIGFDVWYDNPGDSGSVSFGLRDADDNLLASRTVMVPTTSALWGGTKLHIDFNSQVAVEYDAFYKIKIVTALPEFALYKANRVQLLQHNENGIPEALIGYARIGTEDQDYSFKYTLSETSEGDVPVIVYASGTAISAATAQMNYRANEPVDAQLRYGPKGGNFPETVNYSGIYKFCVPDAPMCGFTFGVNSGLTYEYELSLKDFWGNISIITGTFVSPIESVPPPASEPPPPNPPPPPPNPTPPPPPGGPPPPPPGAGDTMSPQIVHYVVSQITDTGATFEWTTDEAADSLVLVKRGIQIFGQGADLAFELEHSVAVSGLTPQTTYYATLISHDPASNVGSIDVPFETLTSGEAASSSGGTPPPPAPSSGGSVAASGSPGSGFSVSWEGDGSAKGYRVDIFDASWKLVGQKFVTGDANSITVEDLPSGEYHTVVYAEDGTGYNKVGGSSATVPKPATWLERASHYYPYFSGGLIFLGLLPVFFLFLQRRRSMNVS